MATYQDLQNRIAADLSRSDLTSQIQSAIGDAIAHYEHDRFWFNTTRLLTFQTVQGKQDYGAEALSQIPNIIRVDHLFLPMQGTVYELTRCEPDDFEWFASVYQGKPTEFTYVDGLIRLWPIPVTAYTLRLHMHYRLALLVNPTDTTAWCVEAEQLIRTHAKLILYTDVLEDDEGSARMQNKLPALKAKLDYETSAREATGRIRPPDGHF